MKRNGMTLIEVVLAVFLIGLIASVFFPPISSSFTFMRKAKSITVDIFKVQQEVEPDLESLRDAIDEDISDPRTELKEVFGRSIYYAPSTTDIEYEAEDGNKHVRGKIYSLIATGHVIDENMPSVAWVTINPAGTFYGAGSTVEMTGDYNISGLSNFLIELKRWHVSKEGFDGFIPDNVVHEGDWGTRYPAWPNDYELIKDVDSNKLSSLENYIGRHVIYSVIPVSKAGKYGLEERSNSVYIMGPPVINSSLTVHLDTYALDNEDNISFKNWKDYNEENNDFSTTGNGIELEFSNGKFAKFRNSTLASSDRINPARNNIMTMFVVFSSTSTDGGGIQNIIRRNNSRQGWALRINNGKLEFLINPSANKQSDRVSAKNIIEADKYIATVLVDSRNLRLIVDGYESPDEDYMPRDNGSNLGRDNIATTLGGDASELNISEIIIYNTNLSEADVKKTREFLARKHRINIAE